MILTLKELAEYLKLNERSIQRMIKTGQIEGKKIGGQWRFSGSQIDRLFFPDKPVKGEDAVELSELAQSTLKIPISRLVTEDRIILDMKATNMDEAIKELTPSSIFNRLVLDIESLREKCLDREKLLNTGVGNGIAIPHTRDTITTLSTSGCIVIGRSKAGVNYTKNFEEADGKTIESTPADKKPIHLFFLIIAQNIQLHLHMMGKIAMLASNKSFIKTCNTAQDPKEIIRAIMETERNEFLAKNNDD